MAVRKTIETLEGATARSYDLPVSQCPYATDLPKGKMWVQGWEYMDKRLTGEPSAKSEQVIDEVLDFIRASGKPNRKRRRRIK